MKIKTLNIENFRSVENISLELNRKLNVLVGTNGSGKTTILDTIAISLSWLVNRIQKTNSPGSHISDSDIRYNSSFSSITTEIEDNNNIYKWRLLKGAKGHHIDEKSELNEVSELASRYHEILSTKEQLPIIVYYPVSRVVERIVPEIKSKDNLYILDVYDNALSGKRNYQSFFEWFRIQDDIINEEATSRTKWTKLNHKSVKKLVDHILSLIKKTYKIKDNPFFEEEFEYIKRRLKKDEFIYEEPRLLFHELSRLIEVLGIERSEPYIKVVRDLEHMFRKMEMYSRDYRDNLIDKGGKYEEIVIKVTRNFEQLLHENDDNYYGFISILWEVFILANVLSLWWMSERGRQDLVSVLKNKFPQKQIENIEWNNIGSEISNSITHIIKKELEQKERVFRNKGNELKTVAQAITKFIPEYSMLRVKRTPRPHMLVNKRNIEFNLDHLSDGEKNLITLVGDIARRLAIANPQSKKPLEGEGIVLIDELDLHLHPSWQRLMVPRLLEIFPNCQFIVTTHSPQILSHVQPDSIFLLQNNKNVLSYTKATESYGKNTDRILEDLLGVDARPAEEKKKISQIFKLIDEGKIFEAKNEIELLSKKIKGGEPELAKARVLIKRKEIIGK